MKRLLALLLLAVVPLAQAEVYLTADNGTTSYFTPCLPLWSTDGVDAVTGITNATSNLRVSFIADNESTWTDITSTDIETITTIGTWASPTANTDIRMDECETEGFYQYQFHNDHMSKSGATELVVLITDNGTSFSDQVIFIKQNPVTAADIQSEAEQAIDAKWAATTGTADSGNTTTLVDADLTQSDDAWNGYALEVAFSGQTEIRCVRDFVAASDTLTVAPAFNTSVGTETYRILIEPSCRLIETTDFNSGAIDAAAIAASAIGASEIAADAIGASELATDAIGAAEIATDAIGAAELAADAVDEIAADILTLTIDGTIDLQCAIALTFAYTSGKWTRSGNVVTYRNPGDTANRLVGTITANTSFDTITRTCP